MVLLLAAAIAVLAYTHRMAFTGGNWSGRVGFLPELLFLTGGFFSVLAMQPHADGKYHPTWGDREDGRKLRTLDPVQIVANYIMPTRVGSSNFVRDSVEITAMERYIRKKRRAGLTSFGITHVFLAAYVRTVAKYPALNRFFRGSIFRAATPSSTPKRSRKTKPCANRFAKLSPAVFPASPSVAGLCT